MSDGEYLMAYGHDQLHYIEQNRGSFTSPVAVTLIATEPLYESKDWIPFDRGELRLYRHGCIVGCIMTEP